MKVKLLHYTPLWVASKAIRKCWASEGKSDSGHNTCKECGEETTWDRIDYGEYETCENCGYCRNISFEIVTGKKDKELIHRVGNKNKHASTLEHIVYSFDIDGISRACLQELARHRHASLSVKSTRYTLKELKDEEPFNNDDKSVDRASKYVIIPRSLLVTRSILESLESLRLILNSGLSNDITKYCLPEAYKTSLVWTVNLRALQNFLELRTSKAALWEIRELAYEIYKQMPDEHKYLVEEFIHE